MPSLSQFVDCMVGATCLIPVYVKSFVNLSEIYVTDSFIDKFDVSSVQYITHKGDQVYKADLSFEHSMHGKENICFKAKDINGVESEKVCITTHIEPPDPCISTPCKNSAVCEKDKESGGFKCFCVTQTSGKTCSIRKDPCKPDPCFGNSHTQICYGHGQCFCNQGFTGDKCENNINDCPADACNRHGRCIDGVGTYTCECFHRFSGINCTVDKCPTLRDGIMNCPARGCSNHSCNGRGVCSDGGKCSCPYGYSGQNCETRKILALL
ncbi:neurogenic locus notch homolog protein 1-like [Ruditapes philippinarum]|uniref:neurogenic locus notch homolog protein 1-like n=1 Tax=Ruditapes philippinarum TaxID=129788 RepID=UPI00295ABF66|nr:neurogenic locus notch homolog protein 1-like [Ruditapes philippinarum]